jgi:hypothetical protein
MKALQWFLGRTLCLLGFHHKVWVTSRGGEFNSSNQECSRKCGWQSKSIYHIEDDPPTGRRRG